MILIVAWLGLSLFLMVFSYKLGLGRLSSPGSGLMPFLIGAFLFLLSLYDLISNLFGKGPKDIVLEEGKQVNFQKLVIVIVSLTLYGLLLEKLGFLVITFLLLFFLFWGLGTKRISAIVASVLSILVTYFVFTYFGMRFPPGILRFVGF